MSHPIHFEVLQHQAIRAQLLEAFPDLDEQTLLDTLEGASDLNEMLAGITRAYLEDKTLAAALKQRLDDMRNRLSRLEATADKKRDLITNVMEKAEIKKLMEPEFTLSLRVVPPGLQVTDEEVIPEDYWKPQAPKLDKAGLLATLKSGASVPGTCLGNGGHSISVRTK